MATFAMRNLFTSLNRSRTTNTHFSKYLYRFISQRNNSNPPTYVIIGGVAGGATTSTRLRRNCDNANVIMFERGKYVSFANCGLPYYVGNVIKDESKLIVTSPDMFKSRFNIDVRIQSNVLSINRNQKTITVQKWSNNKNETEIYEQKYDKLVLAVGASPINPPIPGIKEHNGIFSIRTIEDSRYVREYMDRLPNDRNKCVIVGAGFIGLEMAENMIRRGYQTTIIDGLPHVMGVMDAEMVLPFQRVLEEHKATLVLGEKLKEIKNVSSNIDLPEMVVETESGTQCYADTVILGLGVLPENQLATDAGLELGVRGSIAVNEQMLTSDPDIYAVGDVVETYNYITGKPINLALAGPAQQQARIVADNITNIGDNRSNHQFRGVQGSSVCEIFHESLAATGLTYGMIQRDKLYDMNDICVLHIHVGHHADFYPNAKKLHLKLIFEKSNGRILGAQCCGEEGVVKVIDTISVFIQMRGTVYDLAHSELCYSPQHGSARGAVNVIGQLGMNICDGLIELADWNQIINNNDKVYVLDVRNDNERKKSYIDTTVSKHVEVIHIPLDELRGRIDELNQFKNTNTEINTMCQVGKRGYVAARFLKQNGFNSKLCSGGMTTYHMLQNDYSYHQR